MPRETSKSDRWSYLRAALVTLALSSQFLSAIPTRTLNAERLSRPEGQRALQVLSKLLHIFGAAAERQALEALLIDSSQRIAGVRRALLSPLTPVFDAIGITQQWTLFLSAHSEVFRLRVDVDRPAKGWTIAYRGNKEDALGLAPLLGYRRLRGMYHPVRGRARPQYAAFTAWLARRIMREHPELAHVRVSLERIHVGTPGAAPVIQDTTHVLEYARP